ncbi:endolytic transglycosylase MltG [Burkholderiaceae bacterium DAT-1]|nr:endolytic transglycosylase MltG [Burkholderiaceae bacterium DAT-1]
MGAAAAGFWAFHELSSPLPIAGQTRDFLLEPGTTMRAAARQLETEGILEHGWLFSLYARATGRAPRIKAGSYEISGETTALQLLDKLTDGDVSSATVTIVEGWNWRQVRDALNRNPDLKHDLVSLKDSDVVQQIGMDAPSPEGLLFPDTYHFAKHSSDLSVIKRAASIMQKRLEKVWALRSARTSVKTPYEALTLASIIEKETGRSSDRTLISAVFNNRLRIGMRLQTDPSVIYGMGDQYEGNIRRSDLERDTPYNTYTRSGLTPTPIAMPGEASLMAAVNPAESKALYFVARGDGSSQFSESLDDHNRAVRHFILGKK